MAGVTFRWADEVPDSEPLPALEPFYILIALELGDPDATSEWLMEHAVEFHRIYRQYRRDMTECGRTPVPHLPADSAKVLIQYMIWYPREASKSLSGKA